jgi:hypothetical protein
MVVSYQERAQVLQVMWSAHEAVSIPFSRRKRHQPLEQVRCCLDSSTQTLAIVEVLHCPSRPVTVVNVRGGPKPHGDLSGTVA